MRKLVPILIFQNNGKKSVKLSTIRTKKIHKQLKQKTKMLLRIKFRLCWDENFVHGNGTAIQQWQRTAGRVFLGRMLILFCGTIMICPGDLHCTCVSGREFSIFYVLILAALEDRFFYHSFIIHTLEAAQSKLSSRINREMRSKLQQNSISPSSRQNSQN